MLTVCTTVYRQMREMRDTLLAYKHELASPPALLMHGCVTSCVIRMNDDL